MRIIHYRRESWTIREIVVKCGVVRTLMPVNLEPGNNYYGKMWIHKRERKKEGERVIRADYTTVPALSRLPVHVFELWHLVQTSRTEHQAAPGFRGKGNGGQEEINWHGKWDGEVRWEMEIRIRGPRRAHFIFYLISSLLLCVSDRYNIVPGMVQLLCNCRLVFRYVWVCLNFVKFGIKV